MKIGVSQIQSLHGDIDGNIERHEHFIRLAASHQVELLVFPELSLTQYDAPNANSMAAAPDDARFTRLQVLSDEHNISICAGVPLQSKGGIADGMADGIDNGMTDGITISMLIFQPQKPMEIYSKQYLHEDEEPFFIAGIARPPFSTLSNEVAFAICYELSVPQHAQDAYNHGASIYIASVAKTHSGVEKAGQRLASVSREYGMTVFLSNCIGPCDGSVGGGQSAIWNAQGIRIAQMDDTQEGIIIYDPQSPHKAPTIIPITV